MATTRDDTGTWRSISAAVALVTAGMSDCGVSMADLLDGHDQAEVAEVLALFSAAVLKVRLSREQRTELLQHLGLTAAVQGGDLP
jgi:truncated hemoglobin YjbI